MDCFEGVSVFVKVAEYGSFSAAAEKLGLSKSTVSEQMTRLEKRIGARLLQRSTKAVTLTEAGRAYLCQIDDLLDRVQRAEKAAQAEATEPRGPLRISAPGPFAWTHLAPLLPEFMERHPDIKIELQVTTEVVDLVSSGFDLALRLCANNDPNAIMRQLGKTHMIVVAAPELLKRFRAPESPSDLQAWPCLINTTYPKPNTWTFRSGEREERASFSPALVANSIEVLHRLALAGSGAALIGEYAVIDDLRAGRLVRLLPDWDIGDIPVLAIYPDNRRISIKVRTFVDFLAQRLKQDTLVQA